MIAENMYSKWDTAREALAEWIRDKGETNPAAAHLDLITICRNDKPRSGCGDRSRSTAWTCNITHHLSVFYMDVVERAKQKVKVSVFYMDVVERAKQKVRWVYLGTSTFSGLLALPHLAPWR